LPQLGRLGGLASITSRASPAGQFGSFTICFATRPAASACSVMLWLRPEIPKLIEREQCV
jgi:hypothetical protein